MVSILCAHKSLKIAEVCKFIKIDAGDKKTHCLIMTHNYRGQEGLKFCLDHYRIILTLGWKVRAVSDHLKIINNNRDVWNDIFYSI